MGAQLCVALCPTLVLSCSQLDIIVQVLIIIYGNESRNKRDRPKVILLVSSFFFLLRVSLLALAISVLFLYMPPCCVVKNMGLGPKYIG